MTRNEANALLAIILETVAEMGDEGAPSGPMYAAMLGKVSLEEYEGLIGIAKDVGLVTKANHVIKITAKGKAMVEKIAAHKAA